MFAVGLYKLKLPQSVPAVKKIPFQLPFRQIHIRKLCWSPDSEKIELKCYETILDAPSSRW